MNATELKDRLAKNLKIDFKHPFFHTPVGEAKIDYLCIDEDLICGTNEPVEPLETIIRRAADTHVILLGETDSFSEAFRVDKNELSAEWVVDMVFDDTCEWIIIQDYRADMYLFIGRKVIEIAKSVTPNWEDFTCNWFGE